MSQVFPEFLQNTGNKRAPLNGSWDIVRCSAVRGKPRTCIAEQTMAVPLDADETARVIRAHELMHVRISPSDIRPWLKRGKASLDSLLCAEETRVNYLLSKHGFKPKEHLLDPNDHNNARAAAKAGDLPNLIRACVVTWGTAGQAHTIEGITSSVLEDGADPQILEACKEINLKLGEIYSQHGGMAGSDRLLKGSKTMTRGFLLTEAVARLLDQYVQMAKDNNKIPIFKRNDEDSSVRDSAKDFAELIPGQSSLDRIHHGNMGKVKLASDTGRNPRRIHRMLTDPHRRIFDRTKRDKGAIVLIDWSGSMELAASDVLKILNASPGATVAAYAHKVGSKDVPNFWVLAKDGKMVANLPKKYGVGNGVDGPALRWALKNRRMATEPILWVCDGGVTDGQTDDCTPHLCREAKALALKGKVVMRDTIDAALEYLNRLARGCALPGPQLLGSVARA
jgi:hypothetical protein